MKDFKQQEHVDVMSMTGFAEDVLKGLSARPKYLLSKYFYDDEGSRIFQQIMQMPEYYLTDCEMEIFKTQKQDIFASFSNDGRPFDLIELGAGDGLKTIVLLEHFLTQQATFEYLPIDISEEALRNLTASIKTKLPSLSIKGMAGDYFQMMETINQYDHHKKILLFLGSNIGNFNEDEANDFLQKLRSVMQKNDLLFIGFDMKKDSEIILKAYNDSHGYTAQFNLNLLLRINRELGTDFRPDYFRHKEIYNAQTGTAKSYLFSLEKQTVIFPEFNESLSFEKGEPVFMEMSQKYDAEMINTLAEQAGFKVIRNFHDSRQYYVNSLWELIK